MREGGEYAELYSRQEVLGEGGFGKVYRVEHLTSGVSFAAKHVVTRSSSLFLCPSLLFFTAKHMVTRVRAKREAALAEVNLLAGLSNPYICR